jgi:HK97 family phage prohead protease
MSDLEFGDAYSIVAVDHRAVPHKVFRKTASRHESKIIEGYACLYNKPHIYKENVEVFERGCFNETLASKARVDLCLDHDRSYSLGHTDDNLELIDTKTGLAFRLRTKSEDDLTRLYGRTSMSVQYKENDVEFRKVGDYDVRFIRKASLVECSAVYHGAVPNTHLIIRDAKTAGCLRDEVETKFPSDSAFVALQRALRNLA